VFEALVDPARLFEFVPSLIWFKNSIATPN
jgi:hypothetical protein